MCLNEFGSCIDSINSESKANTRCKMLVPVTVTFINFFIRGLVALSRHWWYLRQICGGYRPARCLLNFFPHWHRHGFGYMSTKLGSFFGACFHGSCRAVCRSCVDPRPQCFRRAPGVVQVAVHDCGADRYGDNRGILAERVLPHRIFRLDSMSRRQSCWLHTLGSHANRPSEEKVSSARNNDMVHPFEPSHAFPTSRRKGGLSDRISPNTEKFVSLASSVWVVVLQHFCFSSSAFRLLN